MLMYAPEYLTPCLKDLWGYEYAFADTNKFPVKIPNMHKTSQKQVMTHDPQNTHNNHSKHPTLRFREA